MAREKAPGPLRTPEDGAVLFCKIIAAALVLIGIAILFAGVVWRYVLGNPLDWSGELAEMLFLWLLTLGAIIALWLLEPVLYAIGNADLVIFFVGMVGAGIIIGVPIAFSFGIATLAYLFYTSTIPLSVIITQMNQGMSSIELLAVPMFVVLGLLLEMTGIARALVDCLSALVGHRRDSPAPVPLTGPRRACATGARERVARGPQRTSALGARCAG